MSSYVYEDRVALPTRDWGVDNQNDLFETQSGRKVGNFIIGYIKDEHGDAVQYIKEPIFVDLVTGLKSDQKNFSVVVSIKQTPPVVFRYGKNVLLHNEEMTKYIADIKNALNDIPTDYIIDSQIDSILAKTYRKKGESIRALESLIRSKTKVLYNSALIEFVIRDMIYNSRDDKLGINEMLQRMNKEERFHFFGAILEYLQMESTSNETLSMLLENNDIKDIEEAVNRDIAYRYFLGML